MSRITRAVVTKRVTLEYTFVFDQSDVTSVILVNHATDLAEVKDALVEWAEDLGEIHADETRVVGQRFSVKLTKE